MFDLAHIHVMIVHLPIIGTALALIPLIWGAYTKDKNIQLIGLVIMGASLIGLPIAMGSGEETFEKFMTGGISPDLDSAGAHYALLHYQAAEMISKAGYIAIILVVGQVFFWNKNFKYKKSLFGMTIFINLLLVVGFSYVGYLGGQIRHPEFRPNTTEGVATTTLAK